MGLNIGFESRFPSQPVRLSENILLRCQKTLPNAGFFNVDESPRYPFSKFCGESFPIVSRYSAENSRFLEIGSGDRGIIPLRGRVEPTTKLVCYTIGVRMAGDGSGYYPSYSTIAKESGLTNQERSDESGMIIAGVDHLDHD